MSLEDFGLTLPGPPKKAVKTIRKFVDAPDHVRCQAQVAKLRDGSTARCGRYVDQAHCRVCKQHRKMFREGKTLFSHVTGAPIFSIIEGGER